MSSRERYPLSWPEGWKRTAFGTRSNANFGKVKFAGPEGSYAGKSKLSIEDAFDRIERELKLFGVDIDTVIVSTNLKLNLRGLPLGSAAQEIADPGAAVYWMRKGKAECMAIDSYRRVADNLAAVAASLEALRAIERHGGAQILERAFIGFAQLPERSGNRRPWREVLELNEGEAASGDMVETQFRVLARRLHPDKDGGDREKMIELNLAREDARRELGG